MTKIVQFARDSAAAMDAYTGPEGEIRIDTDNWQIRLHDGATVGGHIFLNRDANDQRYAGANPETAGIGPFADGDRGFLVRTAAHAYALRQLALGSSAALSLTNATGAAGNPTLDLKDTITGDRTFTGSMLINGVLEVDGGINADVAGDLTGNVTGNVSGNAGGSAGTLRSANDQHVMTYSYDAGAGMQPTWLWGTNDGISHRVWNPSGFNVAFATNATNAANASNANNAVNAGFASSAGAANTAIALTAGNKTIQGDLTVQSAGKIQGDIYPWFDGTADFKITQSGVGLSTVRSLIMTAGNRAVFWRASDDAMIISCNASYILINGAGRCEINAAAGFFANGIQLA